MDKNEIEMDGVKVRLHRDSLVALRIEVEAPGCTLIPVNGQPSNQTWVVVPMHWERLMRLAMNKPVAAG
jgi:hypothetical protein